MRNIMMDFVKYPKIINAYKEEYVEQAKKLDTADIKWMVSEKIHGANFGVYCKDGETVRFASRNQFVGSDFFNAASVIEQLKQPAITLFKTLNLKKGDTLIVYGELFGEGVQRDIYYGEKQFVAFDVAVNKELQPFLDVIPSLRDSGFRAVSPELYETLEEALEVSPEEKSQYSPKGCIREGIVIAPSKPLYFNSGSRVIFKIVNKEFLEKVRAKSEKLSAEFTDEHKELLESVTQYVTTARVSNAVSKIGAVSQKDFGLLMKHTFEDIKQEFVDDLGFDFTEDDRWGNIKKLFNKKLADTVRKEFVKHIN